VRCEPEIGWTENKEVPKKHIDMVLEYAKGNLGSDDPWFIRQFSDERNALYYFAEKCIIPEVNLGG